MSKIAETFYSAIIGTSHIYADKSRPNGERVGALHAGLALLPIWCELHQTPRLLPAPEWPRPHPVDGEMARYVALDAARKLYGRYAEIYARESWIECGAADPTGETRVELSVCDEDCPDDRRPRVETWRAFYVERDGADGFGRYFAAERVA